MVVYVRGKLGRILKIDFVRFCIVGGLGFVINTIVLYLLSKYSNTPIFIAQLLGAEIALASNFTLHHNWTYKKNQVKKPLTSLIIQFHAVSWPAIIGSSVIVSSLVALLHMNKYEALVISSFVALIWNFTWSKYVIWRGVTEKEIEEIAS